MQVLTCTWSDADGSQIAQECRRKQIPVPSCFQSWANLVVLFKQHYRREPQNLQATVESLGLRFEGPSQIRFAILRKLGRCSRAANSFLIY